MTQKQLFKDSNLSESAQKWLKRILKSYEFDDGELALLQKAAELRDQADAARVQIEQDGAYFHNRFGEPRQHPALRVFQQSTDLMARLLKQLNVRTEDKPE